MTKSDSRVVRFFGYIIFACGALGTIQYLRDQIWNSILPGMGVVLGYGAIMLTGLVALSVAACLKKLEQRIDALENAGSASLTSPNKT